jgi:D-glycero-D-manno-heptose 1,7-bisphosphate phosphatase
VQSLARDPRRAVRDTRSARGAQSATFPASTVPNMADRTRAAAPPPPVDRPAAVLFDRDGTLVVDVPYNGDPALVKPVDGAREALDRLRAAGLRIGLVSNQSGIARGLITAEDVHGVNDEVQRLLGPFDVVAVCPHGPDDGCACRKPAPGLVLDAARALHVRPEEIVVVGDIGSDVRAAAAAGARGILVPAPATRAEEVEAAPVVASDLEAAVDLVLHGLREGST